MSYPPYPKWERWATLPWERWLGLFVEDHAHDAMLVLRVTVIPESGTGPANQGVGCVTNTADDVNDSAIAPPGNVFVDDLHPASIDWRMGDET
jgi:hypothetical protein